MFKNLLLTIGLVLTTSLLAFSQSGTLKGTITDSESGEPIPFANVIIEVGGAQKGGGSTDFEGNYTIKPIQPGTYTVKATFIGYGTQQINGVIIKSDKITFLDIKLVPSSIQLETVEITTYTVPLIDKDKTSTGGTATAEEIEKMPNKTATAIATTVGGVKASDGGDGDISIRGARTSGTKYYVDGMAITGSLSLAETAIDQVSVILGGVPAQYGDATGGIIAVTTKGPSRQFGAGIELQTSQFIDNFGYNRASINMNGPLIKGKDNNVALLGYFLAGEVIYREDNAPSATGFYQLNDETLQSIQENPLVLQPSGAITYAANDIRLEDLNHINSAQNNDALNINLSGKIDVKTSPTMNLSFGGSLNRSIRTPFSYANTVLNYNATALETRNTYRVFGRFSHRFETDPESTSLIKNVFYNIQADYQHFDFKSENPEHGNNLFDYGYVGQFETYKDRNYADPVYDTVTGIYTFTMDSWADTAYTFSDAATRNPLRAAYTNGLYNIYDGFGQSIRSSDEVITGSGLINGFSPNFLYGLWSTPGRTTGGYQFSSIDQYGVNLRASADVGNHAIQFGFIYEQKIYRGYNYDANGLWNLMRGVVNSHINELDVNNPHTVIENDTVHYVNYDRIYDGESQNVFDKVLRERLGLAVDGTEWIDIDSYNPADQTIGIIDGEGIRHIKSLSSDLSIDMFTPNELLTIGPGYASAYGYDYYGNKLDYAPSIENFINGTSVKTVGNEQVEYNNYDRDALRPVYMAGYIQDKFAFRDLIFNVGLRVDRFDANQPVLKDPYLLYNAKTVAEATDFTHPGSVGNDYVVYVDNVDDPSQVMGYRDGNTWFNAEGIEVTDPGSNLDAGNGVSPYLVDADNKVLDANAFEDYTPQYSFMPRIAFSFPISDDALFFAHYDVLTQRPTSNWAFNPTSYFFWPSRGVTTMNNPNLQPEQTIDYEIGFQQKLTATSSLQIAAFYREVRDQIQAFRYTEAYPKTYYGYNNIDFGTIKGLTLTYDLRRTKNVRLKASYTLQFAKGTGSDQNTQRSIIQAGLPNLRTLLPTAQDQRHAINVNFDYRFFDGKRYNGPSTTRTKKDGTQKEINWLQNTGVNLTFWGGSGTPYTKSRNTKFMVIDGSINGARLPSTFRFDGRIDRDFKIADNDKGGTYINVYLQVLNILNTKNILGVYAATGVPDDDGYLADDAWQNEINSQLNPAAFRELYAISRLNPFNYSAPRQMRVGMSLNF